MMTDQAAAAFLARIKKLKPEEVTDQDRIDLRDLIDQLEEELIRALIQGREFMNDPETRWELHKAAMTSPERMRAYQRLVEYLEG
jgi:hypothetical protein